MSDIPCDRCSKRRAVWSVRVGLWGRLRLCKYCADENGGKKRPLRDR